MSTPTKFPLSWPDGYPVTEDRQESKFRCTFAQARNGLIVELTRLLGSSKTEKFTISCNMRPDKNGFLDGKSPLIYPNPGVAVYLTFNGDQKVIACDNWRTLHENLRAIQLTIESLRSLERHQCAQILLRAMGDMRALPQQAGASNGAWWTALQVDQHASAAEIKQAYRRLASHYHTDKPGTGNADMIRIINDAWEQAQKARGI